MCNGLMLIEAPGSGGLGSSTLPSKNVFAGTTILSTSALAKHGKGKSLAIIAAKLARAVYFMLRRSEAFGTERFFAHRARFGAGGAHPQPSNWSHPGPRPAATRSADASVPSSTSRPWPRQYAGQPLRIDWTPLTGAEPFLDLAHGSCLPAPHPERGTHRRGSSRFPPRRIEYAAWSLKSFPGRRAPWRARRRRPMLRSASDPR